MNKGVMPMDDVHSNNMYLGSNSKRGLELHAWVTAVNDADAKLGKLTKFDSELAPVSVPSHLSPTGCVDKKDALGNIRADKKRQTMNLSAPEPGRWQQLLTPSPNESIDLEAHFPEIHYMRTSDVFKMILVLEAVDPDVQ